MTEPEAVKPAEKPKSLAKKILAIQAKVGVVKKKGTNREQGYQFLRIEDAVLAVNQLLVANGLLLTQTLQKRPDGTFYFDRQPHKTDKGYMGSVVLAWTLEDVDTGESRSYDIPGEGYDSTDKAMPKAITSSRKQAIITIFNLPIGNDIEERDFVDREAGKAKAKEVGDKKAAALAEKLDTQLNDRIAFIKRPQEANGHYVAVSGFLGEEKMQQFLSDCAAKRFQSKLDGSVYWRLPENYEKDFITLCGHMEIEVQG